VDTLIFYGSSVYVEAEVVRSPQSPGDVGTKVAFWVSDSGNGNDAVDNFALAPGNPYYYLNWMPIKGNFTVRGG
jgi:hypothetical protein